MFLLKNFYRDGGLVISAAALVGALLVLEIYILVNDTHIFWLSAPFITLIGGFMTGKLIQVTRKTFQYYARIDDELEYNKNMSVYSFPMSAAIIDSTSRIVWTNEMFAEEFPECSEYGMEISRITSIDVKKFFIAGGVQISYKEKVYRVFARVPDIAAASGEAQARKAAAPAKKSYKKGDDSAKPGGRQQYARNRIKKNNAKKDNELTLLFFKDITEFKELETEKRLSQPVVVLFMVDGYEELVGGGLESEKAHVSVQIDQLLEKFVGETNGILKKNSSDRFTAVLEERDVAKIIAGKVEILDEARRITVNDRVNVTLSIGIGRTGKNLKDSENMAKQALEMALGRGGDQAAIKTTNGFEFYGGVSKGIERHNKVKTRIIANSLLELVANADKVYIMGHRFSDLDSVGSSAGLACAIRNLGKSAWAVTDRETSLAKELIDLLAAQGQEEPLFIPPSAAISGITEDTLLIICDTHNPLILESAELYEKAEKVVVIDHHRRMVNCIENAAIFHHEPYASSASEMVTELIEYFGDAGKLRPVQSECLLAGIMLDTKNFIMRTGVRTFEAAARLKKMGADTVAVKKLFAGTIECYKRKTQIVASAEIYRKCAIAACDFYADDLRIAAPQAADELLSIKNVDASFTLYRTMANEISISARSMGELNVQLVMEALGGGGHQTMAGMQLKNSTIDEAIEKLKKAIDDYYASLVKSSVKEA